MDRLATRAQLMRFASQEYQEQRRNGLPPAAAADAATRQVWEHFPTEAALFRIPRPGRSNPCARKAAPRPASFGRTTAVKVRDVSEMTLEDLRKLPGQSRRRPDPFVASVPGRPGERLVYEVDTAPAFVMPSPVRSFRVPAPDNAALLRARARKLLTDPGLTMAGPEHLSGDIVTTRCTRCDVDTRHRLGLTYQVCLACEKITERNPLSRTETASVLLRARMAGKLARTFAGWPEGVAKAAKMAAYQEVARDFGQAGGPAGQAARHAAAFGPPYPGDPDYRYRRNVPAHVLDAGWRAHKAAKKSGASEADAKAAGLRAVWAQYPSEAAAWGIPRPNPPRVLGRIPGRMKEIRYHRTGRDRGPYFHKFGPNVRAFACADGSILLRGPRPLFVNQ